MDNTDSGAVFNRDAYVSYEYRELSSGEREPEVQESLNIACVSLADCI